jgi:hypothetical protein
LPSPAAARPVVIYIAGAGRSGSTLLELLLASGDGVVAGGELTYFWQRGVLENQLCGCGQAFTQCGFWREVAQALESDVERAQRRSALRDRCMAFSALPRLIWPSLQGPGFEADLGEYRQSMERLYAALSRVAGRPVVIDSSKYPSEAFLLGSMEGVAPLLVHLVRDPRGVVYSWQKKKRRPEIHWTTAFMPRYSTVKILGAWALFNSLCGVLRRTFPCGVLVRYEDLVADPERELRRILDCVGRADGRVGVDGDRVTLETAHTVSGNPMRFRTGELQIREDAEWRTSMSAWKQALISVLMWPWLLAYGYYRRRSGGRPPR